MAGKLERLTAEVPDSMPEIKQNEKKSNNSNSKSNADLHAVPRTHPIEPIIPPTTKSWPTVQKTPQPAARAKIG